MHFIIGRLPRVSLFTSLFHFLPLVDRFDPTSLRLSVRTGLQRLQRRGEKMNLRALILHQRAPKVSRNNMRRTTVKSTEDEVIHRLKGGGDAILMYMNTNKQGQSGDGLQAPLRPE